mmetsp:Transcript_45508/g.106440  ORF Transcript_45508/g.106440 Transcript_45508/m.106440 type:complete len:205 (-) Transcript_45508:87-701(-)
MVPGSAEPSQGSKSSLEDVCCSVRSSPASPPNGLGKDLLDTQADALASASSVELCLTNPLSRASKSTAPTAISKVPSVGTSSSSLTIRDQEPALEDSPIKVRCSSAESSVALRGAFSTTAAGSADGGSSAAVGASSAACKSEATACGGQASTGGSSAAVSISSAAASGSSAEGSGSSAAASGSAAVGSGSSTASSGSSAVGSGS